MNKTETPSTPEPPSPPPVIAAGLPQLTGRNRPDDEDEVYQQVRDLVSWAVKAGLMTRPTGKPGKPPAQSTKATVGPVEASSLSGE